MKISLGWLKELVDYQLSSDELANQLSLTSIGVKQQTEDYLELDLTYNRGDLLSLRGVAYEVSGITDSPLKFLSPPPEDFVWVGKEVDKTLTDSGMRSVNNLVDVTNLIMLEYGQPLHSFDARDIEDKTIMVR